ncbi:hypothetical protein PLCT2_01789 [Planctomycetaceae bacterium]|nr:hypothetical protein PLCT2_01789 [Planctomycetaceae bacterium]
MGNDDQDFSKMSLADLPSNLTVEEFGAFFRKSRTTAYRLIKAKKVAAILIGGTFLIPRAEVARILGGQS